jgi:hypothetical protein
MFEEGDLEEKLCWTTSLGESQNLEENSDQYLSHHVDIH